MSELKKITVKARQTIEDIAIQYYGGVEGVEKLIEDNRTELADGYDTTLYTGTILKIREDEPVDEDTLARIKARNIEPAKGELNQPPTAPDHNNDYNEDHG